MTIDGNSGAPRFAVGLVISASLRVVNANLFRFLGIILAVGVPGVLVIAVALMLLADGAPTTSAGSVVNFKLKGGPGGEVLFLLFLAVVALCIYVTSQTAIVFGTLETLRGRKTTVRACLSNAFAALPRVALASIILFVILGIAGLLAVQLFRVVALGGGPVVGALASLAVMAVVVFILVLVWVFIPAIVVERAGPVQSFTRSMALTKGHRWGVLAIFLLVVAANWAVNFLSEMMPRIGAPAAGAVLGFLAGLFFMALSAVLATVGYYLLRIEREGMATEDVVRVFD